MACEHFSWDQRNTDRLIEQWSAKPCLYDPSCADYRDKTKREMAMAEIAGELGTIDSDIRDKMKTLRSQYSRERTHEDKSQSDAERVPGRVPYKSKWMYFARLAFLDEHKRRPRHDDCDLDDDASEQTNQRLAAAMEYVTQDRLASAMSSGGSGEPPPQGGTHLNGLTPGSAAESPDADDTDEAKLMIDPDAQTSRDSLAPRSHRRVPARASAELPWSSANGTWDCPPSAGPRRQRMPLLHAAAEARSRYGDSRARPSRDGARRRESNVSWRPPVLPPSRPAAAAADRPLQPLSALRLHRSLHPAPSVSALAADPPSPNCGDGGLDVDLLLRLADAAAARAVAGCAQQAAVLEDAESAFGHFIARQLRLLTSGHERQVARLRIHQAMVDALAAADDEASSQQPPPTASRRGSSCSRS